MLYNRKPHLKLPQKPQTLPDLQSLLGFQTTNGRRAIEKLDLLLLAIESLDIRASQSLITVTKNLDLLGVFPNYVEIWKTRCHNPLRKSYRNSPISIESFEALLLVLSSMANRFYAQI